MPENLYNTLLKLLGKRFILHLNKSEEGGAIMIMEKNGAAFARTYWFNDTTHEITFDFLSVEKKQRKKGIATELIQGHIQTAKELGLQSTLWVNKETWMYNWYKRLGYVEYSSYEDIENAVWMKKQRRNSVKNAKS